MLVRLKILYRLLYNVTNASYTKLSLTVRWSYHLGGGGGGNYMTASRDLKLKIHSHKNDNIVIL